MQEFENKKENHEKIIDIKGTFEDFIEEEKPELSQEEAIKSYKDGDIIQYPKNKKNNSNENDEEESEDDEHLKRVKKALLESLKRVDLMEKKIFEEKDKESIKNIKVKSKSQKSKENEKIKTNVKDDTDKEKVIEQMRQKMKEENEKGRSREE